MLSSDLNIGLKLFVNLFNDSELVGTSSLQGNQFVNTVSFLESKASKLHIL